MRIVHEAVVQLNRAVLVLMSMMLSTAPLGRDTDGAPVAKGHVSKVVLSDLLWARCCW